MTALVLASSSSSRQRMLAAAGVPFTVEVSRVDEQELKASLLADQAPVALAAEVLAEAKAARVSRRCPGSLVLGADQMLDCEGRWLDKVDSLQAAREVLLFLRGKSHRLTSSAVILRDGQRLWHHTATAELRFRPFSDSFVDHYLARAGDAILSSVGCYHLEGLGAQLFSQVSGDSYTIQGLPLIPLLGFLRAHEILVE